MFLKPTAKPTPRRTPSPSRRVAGSSGQPQRVTRQLLGRRRLERSGSPDHLGDRHRAGQPLPGRQYVAGREGVQQPQLDGSISSAAASLSIWASRGEAGLDRAEAAHRTARRVVRVDARRLDQRVVDAIRPAGERGRVRGDGRRRGRVRAAVEQDPHPHRDEAAVPRGAVLAPDARRMPVHVAVNDSSRL